MASFKEKQKGAPSSTGRPGNHSPLSTGIAWTLVFVTLLNFWSAAFIELLGCILFYYTFPQAWYFIRLLGIRWGWLFPVAFIKWANIRIMVSGKSELLGTSSPSLLGLKRFSDMYSRSVPKALVTINHLSWADSFVLSSWLYCHNAVNGDTSWPIWKWFIYIPVGWIAYMSECPILGYGKEKDLKTVQLRVRKFFKRRFTKFFIFPEGAIFRKPMLEKSHEYAKKNGLPLLNNCLLPKTGALMLAGRILKEEGMKDIVDLTLGYPVSSAFYQDPYDVLDLLRKHREPLYLHLNVRRFSMEDVKWDDEKAVTKWVTDRFVEKDKMLQQFHENKGPLIDGVKEEGSRWFDILIDLIVWLGVQAMVYGGLIKLLCYGMVQSKTAIYK